MLPFLSWCLAAISLTGAAVLDPALYLSPSPPLTGDPAAMKQWSRSLEAAILAPKQDDAPILPNEEGTAAIVEELGMPKARTFWPRPSANYGVRGMGIHIPLTFSLTGSYGTNTGLSAGVIGSSYASVVDDNFNYGKSGLAGSSYGLYRSGLPGTRVYGASSGASWSGWGNGKWGHYGKG
ncbi:hypothetical protein MSG28_008768 [Choristoneura fumiferana]|uniref:Uncharacterized protein n=1 Tax=Choristoneura fumiferana TaxID=7141 RepID=A0ACC0J827_CHOFU|nr:hypothetical protein MSG28_008768 [Choristoneura fumiferana]